MSAVSARVVAYLGGAGSFSEEASRRFVPAHELLPLGDFRSVARAVCQGTADVGVLPISNSRVGSIDAVRTLLAHPELKVVGKERLEVRLHLLAPPNASLSSIRDVSSHHAALVQCDAFLAKRSWTRRSAPSTVHAAQEVAAAANPARAAVASEAAAMTHGLEIIAHDLQGEGENVTVFAIVERRDHFA